VSPVANLYNLAAELRSQELTRVAGYPQGPLRKLKADENDIFNGEEFFTHGQSTLVTVPYLSRGPRTEK
jgi:hypothetical protein